MSESRSLVVRVWVPDRPGALGAVASRIGAVGGDVHEIEVVDRGAGRAVDEFVVSVPDGVSDDLLAREVGAVDGVDVEEVRAIATPDRDPRLDSLQTAVALARADHRAAVLAERTCEEVRAHWAAVVALDAPATLEAVFGEPPEEPWMIAFASGAAAGVQPQDAGAGVASDGDGEVAWAVVPGQDRMLLAGRSGVPFRPRERQVLALLGQLAGALDAG
jgi:hypothetical protein